MQDMDTLLWRALEGAIGTHKTAYLREAPLTSLLGHNDAEEEFTLAHAAGHIAKHAAAVRKENDAIFSGLQALSSVLGVQKFAGVGGVLDGISKNEVLRNAGKSMLKGTAVATGASVPALAVGHHLSDQFTEDARNRALQTAAGTAAIGLGAYGLGQTMTR